MFEELKGRGLLIHHWDTDGVCSARLLLERLQDKISVNKTPVLSNYYLTEEELEKYSKYDFVIIADMGHPKEIILRLAKTAKVLIFDHHLQDVITEVFHYNPVIKGENPDLFPSASWIINDYLKNDVNLFALLGIVGDHEIKIKNNTMFYERILRFCKENKLTFNDLLQMVYLIDSNYKLGYKEVVEQIPHILLEYNSGSEILDNVEWNKNLEKLNLEINKQLEMPDENIHNILLKRISTPYNIISTITRKLAWESGKNTIVLNTGYYDDMNQIYVRSKKNMEEIILQWKSYGLKAGGKKEVLGANVPKDQTDTLLKEVIEYLTS